MKSITELEHFCVDRRDAMIKNHRRNLAAAKEFFKILIELAGKMNLHVHHLGNFLTIHNTFVLTYDVGVMKMKFKGIREDEEEAIGINDAGLEIVAIEMARIAARFVTLMETENETV